MATTTQRRVSMAIVALAEHSRSRLEFRVPHNPRSESTPKESDPAPIMHLKLLSSKTTGRIDPCFSQDQKSAQTTFRPSQSPSVRPAISAARLHHAHLKRHLRRSRNPFLQRSAPAPWAPQARHALQSGRPAAQCQRVACYRPSPSLTLRPF